MNELDEWIFKAEGDAVVAEREWRVRRLPNYAAICFHAQQCAEKYLKGFMFKHEIPFRKTHDLEELLTRILPAYPGFEEIHSFLSPLTQFAAATRNPRYLAGKEDAREAIRGMRAVRLYVREQLGLEL